MAEHRNRFSSGLVFFLACLVFLGLTGGTKALRAGQPGPQGNVRNLYGAPVGAVDEDGIVYNAFGARLGRVDENGDVYNVSGIFIGKVYPNGDIVNQSDVFLGYAEQDGSIYNVSDIKIGSVQTGGDLILSGGAARIIFFRGSNSLRLPDRERRHKPRI